MDITYIYFYFIQLCLFTHSFTQTSSELWAHEASRSPNPWPPLRNTTTTTVCVFTPSFSVKDIILYLVELGSCSRPSFHSKLSSSALSLYSYQTQMNSLVKMMFRSCNTYAYGSADSRNQMWRGFVCLLYRLYLFDLQALTTPLLLASAGNISNPINFPKSVQRTPLPSPRQTSYNLRSCQTDSRT